MKRQILALPVLVLALGLSACGGDTGATPEASSSPTPAATTATPTPTPTPTPTIEAAKLGEPVNLPDADITVQAVEQVEQIQGNYDTNIDPQDGGTLFKITMEWTNKSNDAVDKKCFGPYSVTMSVYDTDDHEMLSDSNSGFIPGNDCDTGLMTGQTGPWLVAYHGLANAEVGYIIFQQGTDMEAVVVKDGLELVQTSN
ncbi:MAG: hypothetical protein L0J79_01155 [Propionibacterium sp.]|nr:hypothetical protein [Propionibacterium sp.]